MTDPFNLQHFIDAQDPLFETVTAELAAGNGPSLVLGDYVIQAKIGATGLGAAAKAAFMAIEPEFEEYEQFKLRPNFAEKDPKKLKKEEKN